MPFIVALAPGWAGLAAQPNAPRVTSTSFAVPAWAFPLPASAPPAALDSVKRFHVPQSRISFTAAQVSDRFNAPDWQPESHPPMPNVVAHGRGRAVYACAYCHLPNGAGRPENATLAGLPEEYIVRQVADMKARTRLSALSTYRPGDSMRMVADSATDDEIATAARYFSRLRVPLRYRVVEADSIPRPVPALGLYFPAPGGGVELLGQRLIEMPTDESRHELRDPGVGYVAYVPKGSIARGRTLATTETQTGVKACTGCHGPQLRGIGLVPPIAGRSPSYILRQLLGFKTGTRSTTASAPMREVAATLEIEDMIAAAAYAGSRRP